MKAITTLDGIRVKLCVTCKEMFTDLQIRASFGRDASRPDGFANICRDCRKAPELRTLTPYTYTPNSPLLGKKRV